MTTADTIMLEIDSARALAAQWASSPNRRQRSFWIGLALAAAVHAVAIIGIGSATPRSVGTEDGANNAINVELVDEKSLRDSMSSVTPPPSAPAAEPPAVAEAPPMPPVAAAPPPPPPAPPVPPEAAPAPPAEPAPPPKQAAATPPVEPIPAEEAAPPPPAEKAKPEAAKAEPTKPNPAKPRKNTQTSELTPPDQLDLSVPKTMGSGSSAAPGSSSAVQRPPGITRSGENDEFARNVIRALQKSMPRQEGQFGRVTVRIVLTENGSRADVKLLKSGGNADLDFNVMFAARQTAYPFPPKNATVADRTFMVTYIYR